MREERGVEWSGAAGRQIITLLFIQINDRFGERCGGEV